jgi:hypothetical protein
MKPTRSRRKCAKYLSVEAQMLLETLGTTPGQNFIYPFTCT